MVTEFMEEDTSGLYEYDLRKNTYELIYRHPRVDITGVATSIDDGPYGIRLMMVSLSTSIFLSLTGSKTCIYNFIMLFQVAKHPLLLGLMIIHEQLVMSQQIIIPVSITF